MHGRHVQDRSCVVSRHGERVGSHFDPVAVVDGPLDPTNRLHDGWVGKLGRVGIGDVSRQIKQRKSPVNLLRAIHKETDLDNLDVVPELDSHAEVEVLHMRTETAFETLKYSSKVDA